LDELVDVLTIGVVLDDGATSVDVTADGDESGEASSAGNVAAPLTDG
jgi:hypothetical protein